MLALYLVPKKPSTHKSITLDALCFEKSYDLISMVPTGTRFRIN